MKVKNKSSSPDLDAVKTIGIDLMVEGTPEPIREFLSKPSSDAKSDYKEWIEVLFKSFGPKKFIEMSIDKDTLYQKLNKTT